MASGTRTRGQIAKHQSQLQFASRRPSLELQKPEPTNQILLEEIRKLRTEIHQEMKDFKAEIRQEIRNELKEINQTVDRLANEMSVANQKIKALERKADLADEEFHYIRRRREKDLDEKAMWDMKLREKCVKIRGVPEYRDEDLMQLFLLKLANFLEKEESLFEMEIDRIFRLNSEIARRRKLPRDIIIYFVRKQTRDELLKLHNETPLCVDGKELQIFKDVPGRLLKKRKDYTFLTSLLRDAEIPYRWIQPEGLTFWFNKKKITIKSIDEAKQFWEFWERKQRKERKERQERQDRQETQTKETQDKKNENKQVDREREISPIKHQLEQSRLERDDIQGLRSLTQDEMTLLDLPNIELRGKDLMLLTRLEDVDDEDEDETKEPELEWELEKYKAI